MNNHCFNLRPRSAAGWLAAGTGVLAPGCGTYAGLAWHRFGRVKSTVPDELLDRFIPEYDVVDRHQVRIAAPPETTLAVAANIDLMKSPAIRWIFKAREFLMGSTPPPAQATKPLIDHLTSIGWRILAQKPGQELVLGAATQPWLADVVFRPLEPDEFAGFREPGYVKIAWTLRADPAGSGQSLFSIETRVQATEPLARRNFRRYWALVSAGIAMIRWISLRLTKTEAERVTLRAKAA